MKNILVTGGAGYIGSHILIQLIENGYNPVVLDNLTNSSLKSLNRVRKLTNVEIPFIKGDIRDETLLNEVFVEYGFIAVIHLAGLRLWVSQWSNHYIITKIMCMVVFSYLKLCGITM